MNYTLTTLAFLVAVFSVFGDTTKDGRLTWIGIVLLCLAGSIFGVGIAKHIHDHRQQQKLTTSICIQTIRGTHRMLYPFVALLADDLDRRFKANMISTTEAQEQRDQIEAFLKSTDRNALINSVNMLSHFPRLVDSEVLNDYSLNDYATELGNGKTRWMEIFTETAKSGISELLLSGFPPEVLGADELHLIQELRNDWLTRRLSKIETLDATTPLSNILHLHDRSPSSPQLTMLQDFLYKSAKVLDMCSKHVLRRRFLLFKIPVSIFPR